MNYLCMEVIMSNLIGTSAHSDPMEYFLKLSQWVPKSSTACKGLSDTERGLCSTKISSILQKVLENISSFERASPNLLPSICALAEKAKKMGLLSDGDKAVISQITSIHLKSSHTVPTLPVTPTMDPSSEGKVDEVESIPQIATSTGLKSATTEAFEVTVDMNNKTGPVAVINKPFVKGELITATGISYEQKLKMEQIEHKDVKPYSELHDNASEMRTQCIRDFNKSPKVFLPTHGDRGEIGVVTTADPQGDKFEFQKYNLGIDAEKLEQTLKSMCEGVKARGVVGILYRREPNIVLVHKHDEPKEAWGYGQKFWSFSGGLMEGGVVNSTIGELYEESGFQLPDTMQLSRIRFDKKNGMFYVYIEDTTSERPGVKERFQSPPLVNQFSDVRYKKDEVRYLHPRRRGDYDSTKVIWTSFDSNATAKEPFVRSTEIDNDTELKEQGPRGRFDSFINRAVQADLRDCLGDD